jgi:hypothetical protein
MLIAKLFQQYQLRRILGQDLTLNSRFLNKNNYPIALAQWVNFNE